MPDSPTAWLWPRSQSEPPTLHRLGAVLREYRELHHLSQDALADLLQVDQTYISKIERGQRKISDVKFLLNIARVLGIPPGDLGLSNELLADAAEPGRQHHEASGAGGRLTTAQELVLSDQSDWRAVRRYLNHHRSALAEQAVRLYPASTRIGRTTLIAPSSWLPDEPVDLADIAMTWVPDAPRPKITGGEPESRATIRALMAGRSGMRTGSFTGN